MKIFKYQVWHLLILLILLIGVYFCISMDNALLNGELLGISSSIWLLLAILSPIVHQVYVVVCWRLELHYDSFSKTFGTYGFKVFKLGFGILIFSRLLTILFLAISNSYTLKINIFLAYTFAVILMIPSVYLFYSVKKYFGIDRAFGLDHFKPEEFKNKSFIKKGIFRYTSNGMYIYGFLILYIPGLILLSKAALLAALFNHLYIWVHYYFTELPDIKLIYQQDKKTNSQQRV